MVILVLSCDKNIDLFYAFHHCMEKYYPTHPEIVYSMETINNPYYKTICKDYPLSQWSRRIRETLEEIDDEQILLMVDDCFIRKPVNEERIQYACSQLEGNIAFLNFERSFDQSDQESLIKGFKKRKRGANYAISIMCGLWDRKKLIQILSKNCDPWQIESYQEDYGYDYYINSEDLIIDWGHPAGFTMFGLKNNKWCKEIIPFFEKEGIKIDYSKRGFYE